MGLMLLLPQLFASTSLLPVINCFSLQPELKISSPLLEGPRLDHFECAIMLFSGLCKAQRSTFVLPIFSEVEGRIVGLLMCMLQASKDIVGWENAGLKGRHRS